MNIRKFFFNNLGLKVTALVIALFVWIQITGKERLYIEKTVDVNVEYANVSNNIDVSQVRPESVRLKIRGTANTIEAVSPEELKLRVNLAGIGESTRLNLFSEDYLEVPAGIQVVSISPKMIELQIEEFLAKEVPIRVRYTDRPPPGIQLVERRLDPPRVTIFGYKSLIKPIASVTTVETLDLSTVTRTETRTLTLKKTEEILRFQETRTVDVTLVVETDDGSGS